MDIFFLLYFYKHDIFFGKKAMCAVKRESDEIDVYTADDRCIAHLPVYGSFTCVSSEDEAKVALPAPYWVSVRRPENPNIVFLRECCGGGSADHAPTAESFANALRYALQWNTAATASVTNFFNEILLPIAEHIEFECAYMEYIESKNTEYSDNEDSEDSDNGLGRF